MEPFIVGLMAALALSFLAEQHRASSYSYEYRGALYILARYFVIVFVFFATFTVIALVWLRNSEIEEGWIRLLYMVLSRGVAPFIFGIAAGATLYVFGRRLFGHGSAVLSATEATAFAVMALLVLVIAMDPSFRWALNALENMRQAKIGNVEIQFSPVQRGAMAEMKTGTPSGAAVSYSEPNVSKMLIKHLEDIDEAIKRDVDYSSKNPVSRIISSDLEYYNLKYDREFITKVVKPTAQWIGATTSGAGHSKIITESDLQLVQAYRNLLRVPPIGPDYARAIEDFGRELREKWRRLCSEWSASGAPLAKSDTRSASCAETAANVEKDYTDQSDRSRNAERALLDRRHVYADLSTSLLLYAIGDYRAAVLELDQFVTRQFDLFVVIAQSPRDRTPEKKPDIEKQFLPYELFRGLIYQSYYSQWHVRTLSDFHIAMSIRDRGIEIGKYIIESPEWTKVLKKVKEHKLTQNDIGSACIALSDKHFKTIYFSLISMYNSYSFDFSRFRGAAPDIWMKAKARADAAAEIDMRCLFEDAGEQAQISADILDTRAAVYATAVETLDSDGPTIKKWACIAHKDARKAKSQWAIRVRIFKSTASAVAGERPTLVVRDMEAAWLEERTHVAQLRYEQTRRLLERLKEEQCFLDD